MKNRGVQLLTCLLSATIFAAAGFVGGSASTTATTETVEYNVEKTDSNITTDLAGLVLNFDVTISNFLKAKPGRGKGCGYKIIRLNGSNSDVLLLTDLIYTGTANNENFSSLAYIYAKDSRGVPYYVGSIDTRSSAALISYQDNAIIVAWNHQFEKFTIDSNGKLSRAIIKESENPDAFKKACKAPALNFTLAK